MMPDDDWTNSRSIVVFEHDDLVNTGVLDTDGKAIYRVKPREPIGFHMPRKRDGKRS